MPNSYHRRTQPTYDFSSLQLALEEIEGGTSIRQAAMRNHIPYETLRRRTLNLQVERGRLGTAGQKKKPAFQTKKTICPSLKERVIFSLAVAEVELDFEHRDLHMANIIIRPASEKVIQYKLDDLHYGVRSEGIIATIIEFTLSRCSVGEKICYYDLSQDEELFEGRGDYQFEMYRMMRAQCKDNWQLFTPRNNVVWIHYLVKKAMCPTSGYRYRRPHRQKAFALLEKLEEAVLTYNSCYELILAMCIGAFPALKQAKIISKPK